LKGENMTEKKRTRRVVTAFVAIAGTWLAISTLTGVGCLVNLEESCAVIPSCPACNLNVNSSVTAADAVGDFGPYSCNYHRAGMIVSSGLWLKKETSVPVPAPNAPYATTGIPLTFRPASAKMCLYYYYGPFGVTRCHAVPFNVVFP
jgi:hypothetical protein